MNVVLSEMAESLAYWRQRAERAEGAAQQVRDLVDLIHEHGSDKLIAMADERAGGEVGASEKPFCADCGEPRAAHLIICRKNNHMVPMPLASAAAPGLAINLPVPPAHDGRAGSDALGGE